MNDSNSNLPWYKDGLCFSCTGCGDCCTGSPGYVWLHKKDIQRLADYLKISQEAFLRKYTKKVGSRITLLEDPKNFDCVFFKERKCTIYPARPGQCRSYPFWPSVLRSKKSWEEEASRCEGINHPESERIDREEIERRKKEKDLA